MHVNVSAEVFYLMWALTNKYPLEWGGLVTADYIYDDANVKLQHINIRKMYIPTQKTSSADCDFDEKSVNAINLEAWDAEGQCPTGWIHSHHTMDVFWSTTDDKCIDTLLGTGGREIISLVLNKKGQYKARYDSNSPFRVKTEMEMKCDISDMFDIDLVVSPKGADPNDDTAALWIPQGNKIDQALAWAIVKEIYGNPNSPSYIDIDAIIKEKFTARTTVPAYSRGSYTGDQYYNGGSKTYKKEPTTVNSGGSVKQLYPAGTQAGGAATNPPANSITNQLDTKEEMMKFWSEYTMEGHYD